MERGRQIAAAVGAVSLPHGPAPSTDRVCTPALSELRDPDGKVKMMGNGWVSRYSVQMQARKQKALVHALAAWLLALAAGPAYADEPAAGSEGSSKSYRHEGFPAFAVGFPAGTRERALEAPAEVFAGSTPDGVDVRVSITDFPFAGILMPIEKAERSPLPAWRTAAPCGGAPKVGGEVELGLDAIAHTVVAEVQFTVPTTEHVRVCVATTHGESLANHVTP